MAAKPGSFTPLLGLATALMVALAGAAVWALAALWRNGDLCLLALPLGVLIGRVLQRHCGAWRGVGAVFAVVFSLAGSAYALGLIASARVAMLMGMRLSDTLGRIGADMALAVAWARLDRLEVASLIAAALLAGGVAFWRSKPRPLPFGQETDPRGG
ncbi:hypothetical protein [Tahibacter harae]|uniref:Vitamin B12 transport system permease protein n=1 Tax=Tahibacter harae TaxID=2963937 RepID=A0ABT1QQD9_9GAMM|nr:hypothetical protein [Tahibacter harae]MCQ4164505.1 hypothetical protein [Tahibacter harae]